MAGKYKIVMVRHGESEWNQKNLFCGWFDANLSEKGAVIFSAICFFSIKICPNVSLSVQAKKKL